MRTDNELQHDAMSELKWEPSVDSAEIGVSVTDGVVTLTGVVGSYAEKLAAERAVQRLYGVRGIAQDIKVRYANERKTADPEIAKRIIDMLDWDISVPDRQIKVKVDHGWVTLTGWVDWKYQADAAVRAAEKIGGVVGVSNSIAVRNTLRASDISSKIESAFRRQADLDAHSVTVIAADGEVVLGGKVKSWHERQAAERIAWAAPGVKTVIDNIVIA